MQTKSFKMAPFAGIILLSGFIILFPFFSSKAQKAKQKATTKQYVQNDTGRKKIMIINPNEIDKALSSLDQIDINEINKSVEVALSSLNVDEIQKSIELSLKSINADSIKLQVDAAMRSADMQKLQQDLAKTNVHLKDSNIQKEIQQAMKEVQQAIKEMEKVDQVAIKKEMEKAKQEIAASRLTMQADMAKARVDIQKARTELTQMKTLLDDMKKDGMIKDGEKVKLEWKGNKLFINDKEQSAEVSEKYKRLKEMDVLMNDSDDEDHNEL